MQWLTRIAIVALTVFYPLAVYLGLKFFDARYLVLLVIALAGLRLLGNRQSPLNHWLWLPLLAILALWTALANTPLGVKLYPVLVNINLLILFTWSLVHPPTMIERFARLQDPELSPRALAYTRRVTMVWCGFFVINGSVSLATTLAGSDEVWALYNGLLAYLLMGLLFAGEWLVRRRVMAADHD